MNENKKYEEYIEKMIRLCNDMRDFNNRIREQKEKCELCRKATIVLLNAGFYSDEVAHLLGISEEAVKRLVWNDDGVKWIEKKIYGVSNDEKP